MLCEVFGFALSAFKNRRHEKKEERNRILATTNKQEGARCQTRDFQVTRSRMMNDRCGHRPSCGAYVVSISYYYYLQLVEVHVVS
jgi:hypothetical protein